MEPIITANHICKSFGPIKAVDDVTLNIEKGKFYVIKGHSGSGKSTFLSILGLLDSPSKGDLIIDGKRTCELSAAEKAHLRMSSLGFIFQEFFLNDTLRAYENVMVPMLINPALKTQNIKERSFKILERLGLEERAMHYPKELSGGEKQRVAIGRALANDPDCILADEPTGNLDIENESKILDTLKSLSLGGKAVVVATHSAEVLKYSDEILTMDTGRLYQGEER